MTAWYKLFDNTGVWVNDDDNPLFNVTMGSFDSAELCEPVGLYLLKKYYVLIDSDSFGLYKDNRLTVIQKANGPKLQPYS